MEGWGILCQCCDDILMAILFTGFFVRLSEAYLETM